MSATDQAASQSGDLYPIERVRAEFPALDQEIDGHALVYLDSAATALKPRAVIQAVRDTWERDCANIHRGVHRLSMRATRRYEAARDRVQRFLGAADRSEIIFVRGATEAINLVASSYAIPRLGPGDEILVSGLEHHANIVPWQIVRERTGATLRVVPVEDDGQVLLERVEENLSPRTRLLAMAQVSNALGTVLPIRAITERAHAYGAVVLVDGAQAVPHLAVNVAELGCDFYAFSGHKLYGPDGIGVLYGRRELLSSMPPYQTGGDMILSVSFEHTEYNELPHRFEAGTPSISGAIGLGAAIEFVESVGLSALQAHEQDLLRYGTELLSNLGGVRMIGTAPEKAGVLSFTMEGIHPHDVGTVLDSMGICVRTGHHCAEPVVVRFGVPATVRASLGSYSTRAELDRLMVGLDKVKDMFG